MGNDTPFDQAHEAFELSRLAAQKGMNLVRGKDPALDSAINNYVQAWNRLHMNLHDAKDRVNGPSVRALPERLDVDALDPTELTR